MRCVLLRIRETVEGALCLLEMLDVLEVPEAMRCVLLYAGGSGGCALFARGVGRAGRA